SVQLTFFSNSQGQPAPVLLLLKSQGNLLSSDSLQFNSNGFRKRAFAKKNWPEGVVQIALQDEKGTIMNERLFFNQQVSPVNVLLKTDRNMYNRRQPVLVSLSLKDKNGLPLETELSVTATTEHGTANPTLRESLLLASNLNASVSAAGSRQPDPEVLDNMLLTFGSGSLQSALAVKKTDAAAGFPRETTLKPQGLVTENGKAISKAIIYLLDTRTGASHLASASEKGTFVLPAYGNRFFYQVWQNGTLLEQAKLHFLPVEAVLPAAAWNLNFKPDSAMVAKTTLRRKIEKVYAETSLETSGKAARIELWPTYPADKYFPLEDYKELRNLEEILREIVPVTRIINRDNIVQANVYNSDIRTFYPHQPLYIIDGQPTWNHDLMLRLDGAQLRQINLYTSAKKLEPFGFFGNNGVIVVITKSRNYRAPELNSEHIWQVPGQGAYGAFRTYNRPVNKPDLRPTLYWNPSLRTAADGTATLNFQTSDEVGPIRIKVEGITRDGQLISEELLVPVQPAG
ncbi:MAG TPA: hypothetical protein VK927_01080, partial [Adhaeribacter sp.]|nr:hypothetical protein [Adhaeribacter sp.]